MSDLLDIALSAFDAPIALWWEWMLPMAAQVAVLAGIVAAIDLLLVRSPKPRLESLLWGLVFLKLLVPPSLASPVSIVRLVAERPVGWSTADSIDPLWVRSAFIAWSLGVILLALLSVLRYRATARGILHRSTPAPLSVQHALAAVARRVGVRACPAVRIVGRADEAAVFGLLRPVVLVPAELLGDRRRLEHVLLHECTHLRRRDPWWSVVTLAIGTLYWFHPVTWLARGRLAALRELACDESVARLLGPDSVGYRQTLADVARSMLRAHASPRLPQLAFALPVPSMILWSGWWGGSLLVARLAHLRRCATGASTARSALSGALTLVVTLLLAACCLPLANPPKPLFDQWAAAQGCLQKRFLILRALSQQ